MSSKYCLLIATILGIITGLEAQAEHSNEELYAIIQKLNASIQANGGNLILKNKQRIMNSYLTEFIRIVS